MIDASLTLAARAVQVVSTVIILGAAVAGLVQLIRRRDVIDARLTIASGVTTALSFQVCATLLTTVELRSWDEIGKFSAIFALRTIVGRLFTLERERLRRGRARLDRGGDPA